jgi:hypothetical protein
MSDKIQIDYINDLYNNLSYFDLYGGSIIIIILLTIFIIAFNIYTNILINIIPIKQNWAQEKCNPKYIPFAGLINKPEGSTISQYTQDNFTHCTQNILESVAGTAFEPLTYLTQSVYNVFKLIAESIEAVRGMISKIRGLIAKIMSLILEKTVNITIPLRQITMAISDMLGKTTAILVTGLYTVLGTYYALKALIGSMLMALGIMSIFLWAMVAAFYLIPFVGFGLAALAAVPAIAITIFVALIITMQFFISGEILGVQTCFDKNVKLKMWDGSFKPIKDIEVGEKLENNVIVTTKMKLLSNGSEMYQLNNIIISGTHFVKYLGNWIYVAKHPQSIRIYNYSEPFIYCINTSSKKIIIDNIEYLDWDDILDKDIEKINSICNNSIKRENMGELTKGFPSSAKVSLLDGSIKPIKDILPGDILSGQELVYGFVEIVPFFNNLDKQKERKTYHLLTDKKSFTIDNKIVNHYDYILDLYLER